jgi:hypothetical protein
MIRLSLMLLLAAATAPAPSKFIVPNFRDLKIATRNNYGTQIPRVTTLWLHGARERSEQRPEGAGMFPIPVTIMQCDQKAIYHLNPRAKTYAKSTDPGEIPERVLRLNAPKDNGGPDVTITIDSVDTGERRPMGSYEARRIKTTITVDPSKGASTPPSKTEIDGWYIDLIGLGCRDDRPLAPGLLSIRSPGHPDHIIVNYTGNGKRGFAIEEASKKKELGNVVVNKTELVEFSEQPLDPSLFEPPPDYTQVQPTENHRFN